MRFRDLEIPSEVVDAHRDGNLVIFVGAGASVSKPSCLPPFKELVRRVARDSPEPHIDTKRTDEALGDLQFRHNIDVHARVARILTDPASEPNDTHLAIARLVASAPTPRLVTTNFDHHLSTALASIGHPLREYVGPAVPLGDDFEGVVYLHGKLGIDDSRLILTDRDFGAAYLRDGWATRFLDRMFSRFHVLFVGYSHGDVTMEYLAKGLRGHKTRFILLEQPVDDHWARLELQVVPYELMKGDDPYAGLPQGLARWAERESAGLLDNDARVAEIVVAPPPLSPEDADFLDELLGDPVQIKFILERLHDPAWLPWLSEKDVFRSLFRAGLFEADLSAHALSEWFARWALADEGRSRLGLACLHELGGEMSPQLWTDVALALHRWPESRPEWMDPWLLLLVDHDPGFDRDLLNYAIDKTDWAQAPEAGLLLIEHLTRPRIRVSTGWDGKPSYDLETYGDAHWLNEARTGVLRDFLPDLASSLVIIGEAQLRLARLLRALYPDGPVDGFDRDSFRRAAIEPHTQDRFPDPLDAVIDLVRDSVEQLAGVGHGLDSTVHRWIHDDSALLRRLAIHAQCVRADLTSEQRVRWLLDQEVLDDAHLHHELFRLIEGNIADVPTPVVDAVTEQIYALDPVLGKHSMFSLAAWMKQHGAAGTGLDDLIDAYQSQHAGWELTDHPDMLRWMEGGSVMSRLPMESAEFKSLVTDRPAEALLVVQSYRDKDWSFTEPSWSDAAMMLRDLANAEPALSLSLAALTSDEDADVRKALISGWTGSESLNSGIATGMLEFLLAWHSAMPTEVAMLLDASPSEVFAGWWDVPGSQELARVCWHSLPQEVTEGSGEDWLSAAIGHPAGQLAQYWVQVIQQDRRRAGSSWSGIGGGPRGALDEMIADPHQRGVLATVVLSSQLRFLDAVDHDWTVTHVLPGLDWSEDPVVAMRNWHGVLTWGFWTEGLLEAGLLTMYQDAALRHPSFPDRLRSQLDLHLATIILRAETIEDRTACATKWTSTASKDARVAVIEALGRVLRDSSLAEADTAWTEWISPYWEARLEDVPLPLSVDEGSALTDLIPRFNASFVDAATMAIRSPASLGPWSRLLREVTPEQIQAHGDLIVEMLVHLLHGSSGPVWDIQRRLPKIFEMLKSSATPARVQELKEAAVAYGLTDARSW